VFPIKIAELREAQRALFWPLVAFNLTIAARSTYTPQTEAVTEPEKLRVYSELQHQILPKCIAHHDPKKRILNDTDLLDAIWHKAEAGNIVGSVTWAITDAEKRALMMTQGPNSVM